MWETINTAPKNGAKIIARDAEGIQRLTWFEMGDWYYRGWRENSDQEEFEFDELWNPVEWMPIK